MARHRQDGAAALQEPAQPTPPPAATLCAFECDRAALVSALKRVKRAINAKTAIPILALARVEVLSGAIRITGTDLVIGLTEEVPAVCDLLGTFLFPMPLLDLLGTSDAERVMVRVDTACMVRVTLGRRSGEYASAIAADYPVMPTCSTWSTVEGRVLELLSQVTHCQSTDTSRPHFMATLYEFSQGKLNLIATDGKRLGYRSIAHEGQGSLLLPWQFIELLALLDEAASFELGRSGSSIFARQGSTMVFGKLVDHQFPSWSQVVPAAPSSLFVECEREPLVLALRGLTSIDEKISARVSLSFEPTEVTISARDSSGSRAARAVIAGQLTGKPFRFEVNGAYLIAALSTSKTGRVRIDFSHDHITAYVIDESGGEVVMGMRQ